MPNEAEERPVRLQIPIHTQVADELERYAEGFGRPVSWMTREMLIDGVENEESFVNWLVFRTVGKTLGSKREKVQSNNMPDCSDGNVVRIQVNVSQELADRIEAQAKKHFRTVSSMASLVVVRSLDDQAWMINFIQSKVSEPLRALIGPGRVPKAKPKKKTQKKVA
ncbi:hypothetical protein N9L06_04355 [Mariniblastus sp.]|nr:hypothetical protein [Mariniblastus sp.]